MSEWVNWVSLSGDFFPPQWTQRRTPRPNERLACSRLTRLPLAGNRAFFQDALFQNFQAAPMRRRSYFSPKGEFLDCLSSCLFPRSAQRKTREGVSAPAMIKGDTGFLKPCPGYRCQKTGTRRLKENRSAG